MSEDMAKVVLMVLAALAVLLIAGVAIRNQLSGVLG